MPSRKQVLSWVGAVALVGGAVLILRTPSDESEAERPPPTSSAPIFRVTKYAADTVLLPEHGRAPDRPSDLRAVAGPGRLRVSWTGGKAAGFEVRWVDGDRPRTRLVATPDVQLDGLADGTEYRIEVRAVDEFGQRSTPATVSARPGRDDDWRAGLTGLLDEFTDDSTVLADVPGSRWHLSGYRGCVDIGARGPAESGLAIDLGCGADEAVLRARQPLRLVDGDESARFAVVTDAAGPGGRLTLDLVPGPADRIGAARSAPHPGEDPTLPDGAIRVIFDDAGARVNTGAGLDSLTATDQPAPIPPRGAGVLHLFEVRLTTRGVFVSQDGALVAVSGALPRWREASALVGVRGPQGRRARIHLAAAGFTGPPAPVPQVVEVPVNVATRQVLTPDAAAPDFGMNRRPLTSALAARVVVTMTTSGGMDPTATTIQLGDRLLPATQAVPSRPPAGSAVTVIADVPPDLLGSVGPPTLSPFVVRAPGAGAGAVVQESYLELAPAPDSAPQTTTQPRRSDRDRPGQDALPVVTVELGDSAGTPLTTPTVAPEGRLVVTVRLAGAAAQWDTGSIAGVQGFQLWLDGRLVAGLPTSIGGASPGGSYTIPMGLSGLSPGGHVLETRVIGVDGSQTSTLENFTVD
ncbi:fibronectin type III domain-containing protein [Actinokineospora sp. HUAS TT18]|uniref:fibronectin type III domain-containing protein n=1 Tax=Actinokineospora sp. HUAS TT18 TaxID=3447451 RepID=UPI003F520F1E